MVRYRRNRTPGGTYFFTATLQDRSASHLVDHITTLRQTFAKVRAREPFTIDAIVVLPDHLHTVWTLPPGDDNYGNRWRAIKSEFSRALVRKGLPIAQTARGEYALWQSRFWEHTIRNEHDLESHVAYIHYNPVKHGWASRVRDWPYSSFHRYVRAGIYTPDWSGT